MAVNAHANCILTRIVFLVTTLVDLNRSGSLALSSQPFFIF